MEGGIIFYSTEISGPVFILDDSHRESLETIYTIDILGRMILCIFHEASFTRSLTGEGGGYCSILVFYKFIEYNRSSLYTIKTRRVYKLTFYLLQKSFN